MSAVNGKPYEKMSEKNERWFLQMDLMAVVEEGETHFNHNFMKIPLSNGVANPLTEYGISSMQQTLSFMTVLYIVYVFNTMLNNLNVSNSIHCDTFFWSNDLKCAEKDFLCKKIYIKIKCKICIYHKPLFFKFVYAILSEEPILSSFHNINIVFKLYLLSVAHKHKTCMVDTHNTTQNTVWWRFLGFFLHSVIYIFSLSIRAMCSIVYT